MPKLMKFQSADSFIVSSQHFLARFKFSMEIFPTTLPYGVLEHHLWRSVVENGTCRFAVVLPDIGGDKLCVRASRSRGYILRTSIARRLTRLCDRPFRIFHTPRNSARTLLDRHPYYRWYDGHNAVGGRLMYTVHPFGHGMSRSYLLTSGQLFLCHRCVGWKEWSG